MQKLITFTCFLIGFCLGILLTFFLISPAFAQTVPTQSINMTVPGEAGLPDFKFDYCADFVFMHCSENTDCMDNWVCAFPPADECTPSVCVCFDFHNGLGTVVCDGCISDQTLGVCLPLS